MGLQFPDWFWKRIREDSHRAFTLSSAIGVTGISLAIVADLGNVPQERVLEAVGLRMLGICYFLFLGYLAAYRQDTATRHYNELVLGIWLSVVVPPIFISGWLPPENLYFIALLEAEFAIFAFLQTPARFWLPTLAISNVAYYYVATRAGGAEHAAFATNLAVTLIIVALIVSAAQYVILKTKLALYESLAKEEGRNKLLEQEIEQQRKLAAVGRLAAGVAHDFNNLLQTVGAGAELVSRKAALAPDDKANLLRIVKSAERGRYLVGKILDFSRRSPSQELEPINLSQFIREAEPFLRRAFAIPFELKVMTPVEPAWILGDATQLEQILLNLTSNAGDAMPSGGILRIEVSKSADTVNLKVKDTGNGIPEDVISHIFEPFFTTKGQAGTGLGLSQVYGLVMQMKGRIQVQSKVNEGTEFILSFPAAIVQTQAPAAQLESPEVNLGVAGLTVLVVEDEPELQSLFRQMLAAMNVGCHVASNGKRALETIAQGCRFDILLTDQTMPDISGLELAKSMEQLGLPQPRILMTGLLDLDEETRSQFAVVLKKPFGLRDLRAALLQAVPADTGRPASGTQS